jgi:hypothetical protein
VVSSSALLSESAYCCCVDLGTALGMLPSIVAACKNYTVNGISLGRSDTISVSLASTVVRASPTVPRM